jgi:hypothetical protein
MSDAATFLAGVDAARARARVDRRGYAFPLFLFSGLLLVAPLLYVPGHAVSEPGTLEVLLGIQGGADKAHPTLIAWFWLATIVGGVAATVWWYRRRGQRVGVETDTRALVTAGVAATVGFVVGSWLLGDLYSAPATNLTILVGAAVAAVVAIRRSPLACAVFATVAFAALGVYSHNGMRGLLVIAVLVLTLAWLDRSVLLGVVGALFTLAAIPANHQIFYWDLSRLFNRLDWESGVDGQLPVCQQLVVPAMILLGGGIIAAARGRRVPAGGRDDV